MKAVLDRLQELKAIQGRHASFIVVDDPLQPQESMSEEERQELRQKMDEYMSGKRQYLHVPLETRIVDPGVQARRQAVEDVFIRPFLNKLIADGVLPPADFIISWK